MERIIIEQRNEEDLIVEYDIEKSRRVDDYKRLNNFSEKLKEEVFEDFLCCDVDNVTEMWYNGKLDENIDSYLMR